MALVGVVQRWASRDKHSIRAISRRMGLSRNNIRRYLRSGAFEPRFSVPDRPSNLDARESEPFLVALTLMAANRRMPRLATESIVVASNAPANSGLERSIGQPFEGGRGAQGASAPR